MNPLVTCNYCLINKTRRIVTTTDGEKCSCCDDCLKGDDN